MLVTYRHPNQPHRLTILSKREVHGCSEREYGRVDSSYAWRAPIHRRRKALGPGSGRRSAILATMGVTDMQGLLSHAARLAFGILATNGQPPEVKVRVGGSGIFISPFLGISARHVSQDFYALDKSGDPGFFEGLRSTEHAPALFQVLEPSNPASPKALWHGDRSWNFFHTDICIYSVSAEDETSDVMQYTWPMRFFDLALKPPPIGSVVYAMGYPGAKSGSQRPVIAYRYKGRASRRRNHRDIFAVS